MTRTLRPFAVLALLTLLLAGCSKSSDDSTSSGGSATYDKAVKFAACMRDNGLDRFPDPDSSGKFGSGTGEGTAAWSKAVDACKSLAPAGAIGSKRTPAQQKTALNFAQCMRDNGIKDFPDPTADGPLIDTSRMPGSPGALSIPGFKDAQDTCGHLIADLLSTDK